MEDLNEKVEVKASNIEPDGQAPTTSASSNSHPPLSNGNLPPCVLVLGMAGSGKTSFVKRLTSFLHEQTMFPYLVNLDPAASVVPFPANIDIRDTINYKAVMKEYELGPNGAIITCLNLFCMRFNQVLELLEKRKHQVPLIIFDTPGQIEAFTWSASGAILTDALASTYPTMIAYVLDIARSKNPTTFMSNMLYACSILYRTKLPFFLVLNKADVVEPDFAVKWMTDFESFQEALDEAPSCFMNDLTRSLSLVLDSFYEHLNWVAVSSRTGQGFDKLLDVITKCKEEYLTVYKPMCAQLQKEREELEAKYSTEKIADMVIHEKESVIAGSVSIEKTEKS